MAVVEAGLGGRYDATSVIPSRVQVLTGSGARAHALARADPSTHIAEEKLAVVRDGGRIGHPARSRPAPVEAVAARVTAERGARWLRADPGVGRAHADLLAAGAFQRGNFALAAAAAEALLERPPSTLPPWPRRRPRPVWPGGWTWWA